jgi:hypothetical protein
MKYALLAYSSRAVHGTPEGRDPSGDRRGPGTTHRDGLGAAAAGGVGDHRQV